MKKASAFIIMLVIFSGISFAGFINGNTLLDYLEAIDEKAYPDTGEIENLGKRSLAVGYVLGVWDADLGLLWDAPKNLTSKQVCDVAVKYLKELPEERHLIASMLLRSAFNKAFPIE